MTLIVFLALAATPLEIRVLEHETPSTVHLEAARISCDGKPLAQSVDARAGTREVRVGEAKCQQVIAEDATVGVKTIQRKYAGQVRLSLEGGLLRIINAVDVEAYLPSVVHAEADGSPPAALEAQAIVSRTFALSGKRRHENAGYHLCDLTHCQLYRGTDASQQAQAAVLKTTGQVLLIGGIVLKPAYFHAACGGHTSQANDVFGEDGAGSAVSDVENGTPRCHGPEFSWHFEAERAEVAKALGVPMTGAAVEALRKDTAARIVEVRAFNKRLSGQEFLSRMGRAFGWRAVRSMKFSVSQTDEKVRLDGTGVGHGVGLCQQGAKALAERGVDARGILQRYFPESQVRPSP